MNEPCKTWHKQLLNLHAQHDGFLLAYNECEANKDFLPLVEMKDQLKIGIFSLKQELSILHNLKAKIKAIQFDEFPHIHEKQRNKIEKLMSQESYDLACAAAKELDRRTKLPTRIEIIAKFMDLDQVMIKDIADVMEEPTLVITPAKSFVLLKNALDVKNKDRLRKSGKFRSDYDWSPAANSTSVSFVDASPRIKTIPITRVDKTPAEQLRLYEKYYRSYCMRLITDREYLVAMHQSLMRDAAAKEANERDSRRNILDFSYEQNPRNADYTLFNQEYHRDIKYVASGRCEYNLTLSNFRPSLILNMSRPDAESLNYRGRASLPLI